MMPIGPLMKEHRLIERMVLLMKAELQTIVDQNQVDVGFVDGATDFITTYADRCHHGKEEDILFRDLANKQLSGEHSRIMDELMEEHSFGRRTTDALVSANDSYAQGDIDALDSVVASMKSLVEFYPAHIEKEDRRFFIPCMEYFNEQEQAGMLQEFWEFDRELIHEKYRMTVERVEQHRA